jgi:hypothetical protein
MNRIAYLVAFRWHSYKIWGSLNPVKKNAGKNKNTVNPSPGKRFEHNKTWLPVSSYQGAGGGRPGVEISA